MAGADHDGVDGQAVGEVWHELDGARVAVEGSLVGCGDLVVDVEGECAR